jgi:hypothetical protein
MAVYIVQGVLYSRSRIKVKLKQADINVLEDAQTGENLQKLGHCHTWSSYIRRSWRDHIKASLSVIAA